LPIKLESECIGGAIVCFFFVVWFAGLDTVIGTIVFTPCITSAGVGIIGISLIADQVSFTLQSKGGELVSLDT
jgi:hypothetical protein